MPMQLKYIEYLLTALIFTNENSFFATSENYKSFHQNIILLTTFLSLIKWEDSVYGDQSKEKSSPAIPFKNNPQIKDITKKNPPLKRKNNFVAKTSHIM
jgi:hypothetical protein